MQPSQRGKILRLSSSYPLDHPMDSSLDNFILSLDSGVPPPFATPTLRTVWHGLRGDWESAHDLAGGHDDPDFAWVHAWLHRIEGDPVNAEYWYQRAGRAPRTDATRDEGLDIARELIAQMA